MSEPVNEPALDGQLHEQQCFSCWLAAIGADPLLVQTVIAAAFMAGAGSGAGALARTLGMTSDQTRALPVAVVLDPYVLELIGQNVRALMAAPASPEVAAAMGRRHG